MRDNASGLLVVFCAFPDKTSALTIGRSLLEDHLCACISVLPEMHSFYWWQEEIQSAQEVLVLFKTDVKTYPSLEQRIKAVHPYKVPEIIAVPAQFVEAHYLNWLSQEIHKP